MATGKVFFFEDVQWNANSKMVVTLLVVDPQTMVGYFDQPIHL
jgi:hypothetical protein